ncbi:hypothetical protein L249_2408, partial [Ophiocordyceps polyrhachis-furcata BCC 54312]
LTPFVTRLLVSSTPPVPSPRYPSILLFVLSAREGKRRLTLLSLAPFFFPFQPWTYLLPTSGCGLLPSLTSHDFIFHALILLFLRLFSKSAASPLLSRSSSFDPSLFRLHLAFPPTDEDLSIIPIFLPSRGAKARSSGSPARDRRLSATPTPLIRPNPSLLTERAVGCFWQLPASWTMPAAAQDPTIIEVEMTREGPCRSPDRAHDRYDNHTARGRDDFRPPSGMRQSPPPPASAVRSDGKRKRDVSSNPSGNVAPSGASSGNAPADKASPAKAPSKARPDQKTDIRRAGDYMCLWAWWYLTKEQNEKKMRRLQSQISQCKSSGTDFTSASDFLSQDKKTVEAEIKRCCSRIETCAERYHDAVMSILSPIKADDGQKMDLSGDEPRQRTDVSASKIKELEAQTAELKEQLLRERERNERLESKVDMLARKFDESSKTEPRKSPAPPGSRANGLSEVDFALIQAKCLPNMSKMIDVKMKGLISKDEVEKRLQELDQVMSRPEASDGDDQQTRPGTETAKTLRSVTASMKALEQSMRSECSDIVGQLSLQIHEFKDVLAAYEGVIEKVLGEKKAEDSTADPDTNRPPADGAGGEAVSGPRLDEQVKELVQNEFNNFTGDFVPTLMDGLQSRLEAEEKKREEAIAEEAGKMAGTLLELRTELEKLKADDKGSADDLARKLDQVGQTVAKVKEGLTWSHERIETLDATWQTTNGMAKMEVEEVRFQVRSLQQWQNNFTTRPLYKDIVAHVTETLPNSVWAQIRTLTGRVNEVQALLEDGELGSAKRRRIEAAMGNGGSTKHELYTTR